MSRPRLARLALTIAELVLAVVAATLLVAVTDQVAPVDGLGVIYLLAVLLIAIRRGLLGALATAVLSVLALNYFFIAPVHRLTIADSENVVALAVFLIVAVVVGRLAAASRARAQEAEDRARLAAAREGEAEMLAGVASMLLRGGSPTQYLDEIAARVARALGVADPVPLELAAAPSASADARAVRVPLRHGAAWLHVPRSAGIAQDDVRRVCDALGGIIDVALERERLEGRAAEAEATRRADVVKTAVLHAISHDLRSPLTAITTAAGGLDDVESEDHRELVRVVLEESERLARLVDDLLDLSRVEAGAVHPRVDWCDLGDVVGRAAENVRGRGSASVLIELPGDLPLVKADATQLERVFTNLLDNALHFSPADQPVQIRGGTGGGKVIVRVVDRGPGVPASQHKRVFEPFVGARSGAGGAGLGLAICRGFVEANGGQIVLQSTPHGETAFAVSLPLVEQPAPVT